MYLIEICRGSDLNQRHTGLQPDVRGVSLSQAELPRHSSALDERQ